VAGKKPSTESVRLPEVWGWSQDDLPFPDFGPGTCINCGFLCERTPGVHYLDGFEVVVDDRASGRFAFPKHGRIVWCLRRGAPLYREFEALGEDMLVEQRMRTIIEKGRNCAKFYPYREGFSPQEHAVEQRAVALELDRRRFEDKAEQERRRFEERMEHKRRKFEIVFFVALTLIGLSVAVLELVHGW